MLGAEMKVQTFTVRVAPPAVRDSFAELEVTVNADIEYQPSNALPDEKHGEVDEWGKKTYDKGRPGKQELHLKGTVQAHDGSIYFLASTKGETPGTWKAAFGTPSLTVNKCMMQMVMNSSLLNTAQHGVSGVHVTGIASLRVKEGTEERVITKAGAGILRIGRPGDSEFVIGENTKNFSFKVLS